MKWTKLAVVAASAGMLAMLGCGDKDPVSSTPDAGDRPAAAKLIVSGAMAGTCERCGPAPSADGAPMVLNGFKTPESVLYDAAGDVYLVSNINGLPPLALDEDGFIDQIDPVTLEVTRFIESGANGATLNGPKGMAIIGDVLYVSDINAVRLFDRATGDPMGVWPVPTPEGTFLNDLCAGPDRTLYATNNGDHKVYRFESDGTPVIVAQAPEVMVPNGCEFVGRSLFVVSAMRDAASSSYAKVWQILPSGEVRTVEVLPTGVLDGIVQIGSWLAVTSWDGADMYALDIAGRRSTPILMSGVPGPADLGYDHQRHRLLLPQFLAGNVVIQPLK
jgi:hypothetical protein